MSNLAQLRRLLDIMQPIVEPTKSHDWTGPSEDQYFAFLQRAVVVRQWEALHAINALADNQSGHFGVTFLRPAYEELVLARNISSPFLTMPIGSCCYWPYELWRKASPAKQIILAPPSPETSAGRHRRSQPTDAS